MQEQELLQTVAEVFSGNKIYNIPVYQRGYKWKKEQVTRLLEDIDKFAKTSLPNDNRFYCLQNITITKNGTYFDVIDGQQRLTTLAILLAFLGKQDLVQDRLIYSVRYESCAFLCHTIFNSNKIEIDENVKKDISDIDKENLPKEYDYQDIYHFVQAYQTIKKWFENKDKENFLEILLNQVKLIVNQVGNGNQEKIFANLNSNKVPLSEVDLIRAMLITRQEQSSQISLASTTNMDQLTKLFVGHLSSLLDLNEKRVRRASELDEYNIHWIDESRSKLFSKFITGKETKGIELLYLLFCNRAEKKSNKTMPQILAEIEVKSHNKDELQKFLSALVYFHHALEEWYNDHTIYHYLGFLAFHNQKVKIYDLWMNWVKLKSKKSFILYLKNQCLESLLEQLDEEIRTPSELVKQIISTKRPWYGEDTTLTIRLLILLDVIAMTTGSTNSTRRIPVAYFQKNSEHIEHIFCQTLNSEEFNKHKVIYVEHLNKALKDTNKVHNDIDYEKYVEAIKATNELNSIGNLVLLNGSVNSSYGNNPFEDKRKRIISENIKGVYIRLHTLNTFTSMSEETKVWTTTDIKKSAENISKTIAKYFNIKDLEV